MSHILIALLGWLLILCTLPGTIELALLTFGGLLPYPTSRSHKDQAKPTIQKIAIVIPAHDEAAMIVRCVSSIVGCARPSRPVASSVIVIADNCTDATAALAWSAGARVILRFDTNRRGKGFALQDAFAKLLTEGFDAIAVVDADTVVETNFLSEIVRLLDAGADGAQTRYRVLNPYATTRTRLMSVAFMAMNVLRPRGRVHWGLSAGLLGNGFALSRKTLEAVPYDAHSVVEDLEYHLRIVRSDRRIAFADRTTVRGEMPTGTHGARTQRARWEGGRLRMIAQNVPTLAREVIRGRFRLLEPLLDLLLLPLGFHLVMLATTLAIPYAPARIYAASAIGLVAFHVGAGIAVSGGGISDVFSLLAAPFYILWKVAVTPEIFRSGRRKAAWIRTER
jgi:cellulose synthase/poly-beta-1,6-N-acetylglucosamine synthase-like glycosyltransferase